jgi:nucleotide-binding universal stress UspA family protein
MRAIETGVRLALKNILLLTDFSEPSELAIPFAIAIAREYESKVYAMPPLLAAPARNAVIQAKLALHNLVREQEAIGIIPERVIAIIPES